MKIALLILAAGKSSRMGDIKQLLPYKETCILGKVIESALESEEKDIHVVLGANASVIKNKIKKYPIKYIINENYERGLSSSILCGIKTLSSYDAVLISLGDQPKIDAIYLNKMISFFKKNKNCIVTSEYDDFNGVPAIFPKLFYTDLLKIKGDKGAKQLLNSKLNYIKSMGSSEKLLDIDTPEDYQKLITK